MRLLSRTQSANLNIYQAEYSNANPVQILILIEIISMPFHTMTVDYYSTNINSSSTALYCTSSHLPTEIRSEGTNTAK